MICFLLMLIQLLPDYLLVPRLHHYYHPNYRHDARTTTTTTIPTERCIMTGTTYTLAYRRKALLKIGQPGAGMHAD